MIYAINSLSSPAQSEKRLESAKLETQHRLTWAGPIRASTATTPPRSATAARSRGFRFRENLHAANKTHMTTPASGSSTLPGNRSGSVRVTRATYSAGGVASHPHPSFFRTFAGCTCTPGISVFSGTRLSTAVIEDDWPGGKRHAFVACAGFSTSAFTRHRARKCTERPYF